MKERLTRNLWIKLLSLFCAFFVWLAVVNIANPIVTATQEIEVEIVNDSILERANLAYEVVGKKTATIMFFNGTSETPDGPIEYLRNPYRTQNLAFSFQMKLCADAIYPGFTRNIYLKGLRYNQHLRPCSALIEVGAQNNTYEEARNAMEPLAELLDMVLRPR